jgi:hypothetical protein
MGKLRNWFAAHGAGLFNFEQMWFGDLGRGKFSRFILNLAVNGN